MTNYSLRIKDENRDLLVLLVVSVPFLFLGIGSISLLDPDEGLYAAIAREMIERGDWVIPYFNGLSYLEKPPLYFWLTSLTMWLGGPSEWAVRLWSRLPALGTVLLVWRMGRQLYGPAGGLVGGLALATTAGVAIYVHKASTDFLLIFCLTLAIYGFIRDLERTEKGRTRFLLLYLGAALALMSKGLIGVVFPVLIVGISMVWVGRPALRHLNLGWGAAVFGGVTLPWHLFVAWRDPSLLWFYVVDNQLLRFLNIRGVVEDDVPISTIGFLLVSFLWFFPWGVFLLARPASDPSPTARWRAVIVIWALVVFVFFSLARSKLEYYSLPAFPAMAILVGGAWAGGRDIGRWLWVGLVGCSAVGIWMVWQGAVLTSGQALAGLAEMNVYYRILHEQGLPFPFPSPRPFGLLLQGLGLVLLIGWGFAVFCWMRRWPRASFGTLLATAGVIAILILQLFREIEPHHSAKAVSYAVKANASSADLIVHEGSLEYSAAIPFYTGRRVVVVNGKQGELGERVAVWLAGARGREAEGWYIGTRELAQLWQSPKRIFFVTQRPWTRSILATLPSTHVNKIGRYGSRWLYSNR